MSYEITKARLARAARWLLLPLGLALSQLVAPTPLGPAPAHAVIGRPVTPLSYAGVARRTSRRTARRTSVRYGAYPYPYPYYGAMAPEPEGTTGGASPTLAAQTGAPARTVDAAG